MFSTKVVLLLTILCLVSITQCARILCVLPLPSLSHQKFYGMIIKELVRRDHDVVSITTDPINDSTLTNLTEMNIHDVAYNAIKLSAAYVNEKANPLKRFGELVYNLMDQILADHKVQRLIHNQSEHFDLLIVEAVKNIAGYGFKQRFNCPMIGVTSLSASITVKDAMGNPIDSNYYIDFTAYAGPNLSFWQRLYNVWYLWETRYIYHFNIVPRQNQLVQKYFGENYDDLWEVEKTMDLLLTNTIPLFHIPQPYLPNLIPIGGMHQRQRKPLPRDLQKFLDNSKQGVVYFSLGSIAKSTMLSQEKLKSILRAFKKLPYNVLWKWENTTLAGKPENVLVKQWLPQQQILDHPNVIVFVTQCGMHSIEEAINSKVPMIGIPYRVDQYYNADRIVALGIGRKIMLDGLTADNFFDTIMDITQTSRYKKDISTVASLIWDQETKPLDRAIWWIEYVIRHRGAGHLRSVVTYIPWYKCLFLDIIGFVLGIIILILILFISLIRRSFKLIFKGEFKIKRE